MRQQVEKQLNPVRVVVVVLLFELPPVKVFVVLTVLAVVLQLEVPLERVVEVFAVNLKLVKIEITLKIPF